MSRRYFTYVKLDLVFDLGSIKMILNKGLELGYSYQEVFLLGLIEDGQSFEAKGIPLVVDDIITKFEIASKENNVLTVNVILENSYTDILFINSNEKLSVMFSDLSPVWSRIDFDGEEEFDVQRYALALFNLVKEYKVLEFSIQKDW